MKNRRTTPLLLTLLVFSGCGHPKQIRRTEHWHARNERFETQNDSIPEGALVFLGNSLIEGFDLEFHFPRRPVVNRGIIADHIDGVLERLDDSVVDLKPSKLFLMIGINDIGDGRSEEWIMDGMTALADALIAGLPGTTIYIHSLLPASPRWKNCPPEKIRRINARMHNLAGEKNFRFIDLHNRFAEENGHIRPDLTTDGLHLNPKGYALWAEILRPEL